MKNYLKQITISIITLYTLALTNSCEETTERPSSSQGHISLKDYGWIIPPSEVFDGGPGKDGIPALDHPEFITSEEASYLEDTELVLGFKSGGSVHAYPHEILDYHENINDELGGVKIAVTYCPLTGTGIGWDRIINNKETTFGVAGLLYNTNLILYDRETDSNWSQMRLDCVQGKLVGMRAVMYQLVETSWGNWKAMYPNSLVVSRNTGHDRNYDEFPYRYYKYDNDYLIFPVNNTDNRLPQKERVLGIFHGSFKKVYRFEEFGAGIHLIKDIVGGDEIIIVGSNDNAFMVAFYPETTDGHRLQFEAVQEGQNVIMKDIEGNQWDIFGQAVTGPGKGQRLKQPRSFMGYWFAWAAFYPNVLIYSN